MSSPIDAKPDQYPAGFADAVPGLAARSGSELVLTPRRAAPAEAKPDLVERGVRWLWTGRAKHGPVTSAGLAFLDGQFAHQLQGGQDLLLDGVPALLGVALIEAYRRRRRAAGRPLVLGQRLWQYAVAGAASLYVGVSSAIEPRTPVMGYLLACLAGPLGITWWFRKRLVKPGLAPAPSAEPEPAEEPEPVPTLPELYARAWQEGIACAGGKLPGSALINIRANPAEAGGGFTGRVVLAVGGGAVTQTPDDIVSIRDLIFQAFVRVNEELDPTNLVIEPQRNGTALVSVFDCNPLVRSEYARPSGPGTYEHRIGRIASGKSVTYRTYIPGYGRPHVAAVGSTGGGKSSLMNMLIGLDGHTLTADGAPLVCPIICDPHEGVSYSQWEGRVRIASSPEEIAGALLLVCIIIKMRLKWMKDHKVDLLVPSPEMPMIPVYLDEVLQARAAGAAAGYPIEAMIRMIAIEGRKALAVLVGGLVSFDTDSVPDTKVLDAFVVLFILRSIAASTGLKVNTGMWATSLNPQLIPAEFADGSPTTGYGYYVKSKTSPPQVLRYDRMGAAEAEAARFADGGPISHVAFAAVLPQRDDKGKVPDMLIDVDYWAQEFIGRMAAGRPWVDVRKPEPEPGDARSAAADREDPRAADGEHTPVDDIQHSAPASVAEPVAPSTAAREGSAWERIHALLDGVGAPLSLEEMHAFTGIPKSTISMAIQRRRGLQPPVIVQVPVPKTTGIWSLPPYQHVPYTGAQNR